MNNFEYFKKKIYCSLLLFYITLSIIIPAFFLNKVIFIILMTLYCFDKMFFNRVLKNKIIAPVGIFGIYTYGVYISLFSEVDYILLKQLYLATLPLFLIYIIKDYEIEYDKIILRAGKYFLMLSLLLTYLFEKKYFTNILDFFMKYSLIGRGYRQFGSLNLFMFHLGTVPFVYLLFCILLMNFKQNKIKNTFWMIISVVVCLLSTSRALIFAVVLYALYFLLTNVKKKYKILLYICIIVVFFISIFIMLKYTTILSTNEHGNSIKLKHIISYFKILSWKNLIFGNGLGTVYFSYGVNKSVAQTEVTLIDLLRYFGVFFTSLLYYFMYFPSMNLKISKEKNEFIIFSIYLIMSLTNPILLNSFGVLIILWYWSKKDM